MSATNESSTSQYSTSQDWPANAIPKKWVEVLFETMTAVYGSRFADLWRGADVEVTKRVWGVELAKLSSQQMKAGRENLTQLVKVPTLPEFVEHCKRARVEAAASAAPQLVDGLRASAETIGENMPQIQRAARRASSRNVGAVGWAFEMVETGKARNGMSLPPEVLRHAEDAVLSGAGIQAANRNDAYAAIRRAVINKRGEAAA